MYSKQYTCNQKPWVCMVHPGRSIKWSIDGTDLGNKATRGASCACGEVCLLSGRESEHTLGLGDRDQGRAVRHQGNRCRPSTAKPNHLSQPAISLFHQLWNQRPASVTPPRRGRLSLRPSVHPEEQQPLRCALTRSPEEMTHHWNAYSCLLFCVKQHLQNPPIF